MIFPDMSRISSLKASPYPTAGKGISHLTASHITGKSKSSRPSTGSHITEASQPTIASYLTPDLNAWRLVEDNIQPEALHEKLQAAANATFEFCVKLEQAAITLPGQDTGSVKIPMMLSLSEKVLGKKGTMTCLIDVVCAIDVSGSMDGAKISHVKKSLKLMLNFLENSRLALILFSDTAERVMNFKTVNAANKSKIEALIDSLFILKNTNITQSIHLAQEMIGQRKHKNPACSVFLLSDGIHNRGPISKEAMFAKEQGPTKGEPYTVHTFGYGDDHDAHQLQSIAEHKFGNYYFVDDIERVDEYFVDCIGSITSMLALDGKINFKFTPGSLITGVQVVKAYSPYIQSKASSLWTVDVPSMYAGMNKDFIVMLKLNYKKPPKMQPTEVELANLSLSFRRIGTNTQLSASKKLSVTFVDGAAGGRPPIDLDVRKNYLRVRAAEVIAWAIENKKPNYDLAINELATFKNKELGGEPALLHDPVLMAIATQVSQVMQMLLNEKMGVKNRVKVANFAVEAVHMMKQQQSNPVAAYGQLNRNCYQASNSGRLAGMKHAYY